MVEGSDGAVLRQVGRLLRGEGTAGLSDGQLLERFATRGDEGAEVAFEAILRRHGPMVLGVCRRVLRDPHAADDAFQATFLVLARKARSVRVESSLGHWLYGVTYRIAVRARVQADRRRAREGGDPDLIPAPPDDDVDRRDLDAAIHEEVARLPEKYRRPIVLCYLEGRSHEAAAEALRWPVGTVRGRLARARDLLRRRLSRRGLAPSAGMIGACLAARGARAGVPAPLLENTVAAAARVAAGRSVAAGMVSATAAALSEGALRTMTVAKLKWAFAGVIALGIAGGAGARAYQGLGHGPGPGSSPIQLAQARGEERKEAPRPEAEKRAEAPPTAEAHRPARSPIPPPSVEDPRPETPTLPEPVVANEPPPQAPQLPPEPPPQAPQLPPEPVPQAEPGPPFAVTESGPVSGVPIAPEPPNVGQVSQNLIEVKNGLTKRIAFLEGESKNLRAQAEAADKELKSARAMIDAIDRVLQRDDAAARVEALQKAGFMARDPRKMPPLRQAKPPGEPKMDTTPDAPRDEAPRVAAPGDLLDVLYPADAETEKRQRVQVDSSGAIHLEDDAVPVAGMTALDIKERIVHMLLFKRGLTEERLGLTANRPGSRVRPRDTFRVRVNFVAPPQDDPEPRIRALEDKLDRLIDELKAARPAAGGPRDEKSAAAVAAPATCTVEGNVERPGQYPVTGAERIRDLIERANPRSSNPPTTTIRITRTVPARPGRAAGEMEWLANLAGIRRGEGDQVVWPGDRFTVVDEPATPEPARPRDVQHISGRIDPRDNAASVNVEDRLRGVEQKLDRLLKAMEPRKAEPEPEPEPAEPAEPRTSALGRFFEMLLGPSVPVPLPHYMSQPQWRVEQLLVDSEDLHQADGDWNRFWFLDQPSNLTPFRTHGGLGP